MQCENTRRAGPRAGRDMDRRIRRRGAVRGVCGLRTSSDRSNNKVDGYQNVTVHITTHRLLVVYGGLAIETQLKNVRQSELYNGFMRSSPKITLTLGAASASASVVSLPLASPADAPSPPSETWTCGVCGSVNQGSANPTSKCQLCGVAYATSRTLSPPPTRSATPASLVQAPTPPVPPGQVACSACTFLNDTSLPKCEMCGTALPRRNPPRLSTPLDKENTVRLSFREGGVREAYRRLKGVLSDKVWERVDGGSRPSSTAPQNKSGGIGEFVNTADPRRDYEEHVPGRDEQRRRHAERVPRPRGPDGPRGGDGESVRGPNHRSASRRVSIQSCQRRESTATRMRHSCAPRLCGWDCLLQH